ncbi:GntR family transcriptional regulator [Burkholderia sp. WAC0059]|uniref:GntR family transcriptional regulator n=1 Tax=Burkholderia sp. WAC0059 TaxID=2066022 RepID=UPI002155E8DA|nr:GntR family transcriptional regulator [Burkholderia sp. WAC0059]
MLPQQRTRIEFLLLMREVRNRPGPYWLSIVAVLQEAIESGRLGAGQVLPAQRLVADFTGLHVNTVNRGMREAARRGLVVTRCWGGTVIRHAAIQA